MDGVDVARKKGKQQDSRAALLDAAWSLLLEQGPGGMSVDAIVTRARLSKGTFFHFFETKQALLDAVCARIADESDREVGGVLERTDLDPIARLDRFFQASRAWRTAHSKAIGALWRELMRDENAALMSQVRRLSLDRMTPAVAQIIAEANRIGRAHVTDVEVVSRLVVEWIHATVEGSLGLFSQRRDAAAVDLALRRANATLDAMERVLGVPAGSFRRVDRAIVAKLAAAVPGEDAATKGGSIHERSHRKR